jgi:hypothetical protein
MPPLFTVCLLASCIYPLWHEPLALLALVGLGYGIIYVTALHILMFFSLLAWAAGGVPILEAFCKSIFGGLFS